MALIDIVHLTKVFYPARPFGAWLRAPWRIGQPVTALNDVSLTIEHGELCCLMGSNGAGKTTLLKVLAGLVLPTSGIILVSGTSVQRSTPQLRSRIGFASSDRPGFYDRLTGRQNLGFFAGLHGLSARAAAARIEELREWLALEALDRHYQEYSAGMRQRLLLARALLHDPPILLLDEPTKSLDPAQSDALQTLIADCLHRAQRTTILLTTHRPEEARRLGGRVAVLHQGSLRACGTVGEVAGGGEFGDAVRALCR